MSGCPTNTPNLFKYTDFKSRVGEHISSTSHLFTEEREVVPVTTTLSLLLHDRTGEVIFLTQDPNPLPGTELGGKRP